MKIRGKTVLRNNTEENNTKSVLVPQLLSMPFPKHTKTSLFLQKCLPKLPACLQKRY